jgi:hypothetical protein
LGGFNTTLVKNWKRTSPASDRSAASLGSGLPYLAMNSLSDFCMVSQSTTVEEACAS